MSLKSGCAESAIEPFFSGKSSNSVGNQLGIKWDRKSPLRNSELIIMSSHTSLKGGLNGRYCKGSVRQTIKRPLTISTFTSRVGDATWTEPAYSCGISLRAMRPPYVG